MWTSSVVWGADPAQEIQTILALEKSATGQTAANAASLSLADAHISNLPLILQALNTANPVAENVLRGTAESMCDQSRVQSQSFPKKEVQSFVLDQKNKAQARSFAFELLSGVDAELGDSMVPGFINDPSDELRRMAVTQIIQQAEAIDATTKPDEVKALYEKAFVAATDDDQVRTIRKGLKKLGVEVNLQDHFGFINKWSLIGPFNNVDKVGFATAYPPEKTVDLKTILDGQNDKVEWKEFTTDDEYGLVNIAKDLGPFKGAVAYAYHEFDAEQAEPVQFRLGTPNAWKLWVNGELLFAREEYHRGDMMDQYRVPGKLAKGKNTILLKVCQNEQTQDWAQKWAIQFRICDLSGRAVKPAK
jgi:hypothetical protein